MQSKHVIITAILVLLMNGSECRAHKSNVFAYTDSGKIVVEGYFGGKSKAINSPVLIKAANGSTIIQGQTDENGVFSADLRSIPANSGDLSIILQAGPGHQSEYVLSRSEYTITETAENRVENTSSAIMTPKNQGPDNHQLKLITDQMTELKSEVAAVKRAVVLQNEKRVGISEIIGGLGWIMGLIGIWAFCLSRRGQ